ncbi:MAG: 1-acyl-sn-glycerol-3-phosphate acyltransferase [Mollicutes bacterium]|jgi:1-acyl-sn-glycerol-3-phosphate acyltransferase/uncharacterized HAD superfamily protein|nr:1-acyl-sn-glycerol-3-phosphate acyltransferase [Mollicutes bacterium]
MRIGIDIDGTLTDFEGFLKKESPKYMADNHGIEIIDYDGYDIDEMYALEERFLKKGFSETSSYQKAKHITSDFWNKNFIKYLMKGIRKEAGKATKNLYYNNNEVVLYSSRVRSREKGFIGFFVRNMTKLSLKMNGIKYDKIFFFENDYEKLEEIKRRKPDLMIDDKPELIEEFGYFTNTICVKSNYNKNVNEKGRIFTVSDFNQEQILSVVNQIRDARGLKPIPIDFKPSFYHKILKRVSKKTENIKYTNKWYKRAKALGKPIVMKEFKPIVLNSNNKKVENPVIVAPNHRSTIDPFFVIATTDKPIHWSGLKRFFDAEDSIFNNSKNPFLCKFTSILFRAIGLVPIERSTDNPKSNNRESVLLMQKLIADDQNVGVFPEGTTNKKPEEQYIEEGDRSGSLAFALLRESPKASLLPISIQWLNENDRKIVGNRLILNYREPMNSKDVENHGKEIGENKFIDSAYDLWKKRIIAGLEENKKIIEELKEYREKHVKKEDQKVYYKDLIKRIK